MGECTDRLRGRGRLTTNVVRRQDPHPQPGAVDFHDDLRSIFRRRPEGGDFVLVLNLQATLHDTLSEDVKNAPAYCGLSVLRLYPQAATMPLTITV